MLVKGCGCVGIGAGEGSNRAGVGLSWGTFF